MTSHIHTSFLSPLKDLTRHLVVDFYLLIKRKSLQASILRPYNQNAVVLDFKAVTFRTEGLFVPSEVQWRQSAEVGGNCVEWPVN